MKTVTMLQFRKDAEGVLRRVAKGERLILSHRGKPAARIEPLLPTEPADATTDPFLGIGSRATRSPKGPTSHHTIDRAVYGDK